MEKEGICVSINYCCKINLSMYAHLEISDLFTAINFHGKHETHLTKFCYAMIEFRRVRSMLCWQSNATRLLAECQTQLVNSGIASSVGQIFKAKFERDGLSVTGINYYTHRVIIIISL